MWPFDLARHLPACTCQSVTFSSSNSNWRGVPVCRSTIKRHATGSNSIDRSWKGGLCSAAARSSEGGAAARSLTREHRMRRGRMVLIGVDRLVGLHRARGGRDRLACVPVAVEAGEVCCSTPRAGSDGRSGLPSSSAWLSGVRGRAADRKTLQSSDSLQPPPAS